MVTNHILTTVILPRKLNKKIREIAAEKGVSRNSIIIGLIEKFVKENDEKK